jgi:hypothetical protein
VAERSREEQSLSIILLVFRSALTSGSLNASFFSMLAVGVLWSAGANGSLGVCGVMKTGRGSEAGGESGVGPAAWPLAAWAKLPAATARLHSSATVVPGSKNPVEMTRLLF